MSEVRVIPDSVVDNFEDADADPPGVYEDGETISDYYPNGLRTDDIERTTSFAFDGDFGCYLEDSTGDWATTYVISQPGDGLPNYLEQPGTISAWMYDPGSDMDGNHANILFGAPDYDNAYMVGLRMEREEIVFSRIEDGGTNLAIEDENVNLSEETWYKCIVDWQEDGDIAITAEDTDENVVGSMSLNDDTYSGEGVGVAGRLNDGDVVIDDINLE